MFTEVYISFYDTTFDVCFFLMDNCISQYMSGFISARNTVLSENANDYL